MTFQPNGFFLMFSRLSLLLCAAIALTGTASAHETVATEKPVVMPANTGKPNDFATLPGFQVERIYYVPKDKFGSWVSITTDPKGRLVCSDQERKGLYRITPGKVGTSEPSKIEKLDINITAAQGLLFAFDSLYISVNGGPGSGLYRAKYDTSTDTFGEVKKLKDIKGGGEHGPHALRLTPDGRSILLMCGNHTLPPEGFQHSRIPKNWQEDLLLPRQWDSNGHARGILAPGGYVVKCDPDGKTWEMISIGYRNAYDMALNADGELFGYDSDMEWDMGAPWYRPTRVNHAVSGSEFGWRSGAGVWPNYYVDSLPPMLEIGPGSPVGVEFGYGTRFPAKYQKALYLLDWTFGTIYALHLTPHQSTYSAVKEEFLSRTPLPLTDATVGHDGAFYFTTGGRNTQSELFRVTYVGNEPTERSECKDLRHAADRELRHKLEAFHQRADDPAKAVEFILPYLRHEDRFIRYAARVALEHQPVNLWEDKVLDDTNIDGFLEGVVALARQGNKKHEPKLLAALNARLDARPIPVGRRPANEQIEPGERAMLGILRAYSLVFIRMGEPDKDTAASIARRLDSYYPSHSDFVNRELCQLLVYLKSPTVVAKTIQLLTKPSVHTPQPGMADVISRSNQYGPAIKKMLDNAPDQQKVSFVYTLRNVKDGWTMEQRRVYFGTIAEARGWSGGNSYQGFLNNIEKEAFDNAPDVDRLAIEAAGLRKPFKPKELPKPKGPGKDWTMEDVLTLEPKLKDRSFYNGEKMFAAARCIVCHRFYGDGGATGPDMTQSAGRFSYKDMAESIIEPSKVVSDQYRASVVFTSSGKTYTGKIVSDTKDGVTILTDPEDSTKVVEIKRADIDEVKPSAVSLMPKDLLKPLNEDEVMDLMAYLLSRGDPSHPMFKKEPRPPEPKRNRPKK
jgi:putative heme-binding domain-containing protein